MAAADSRARAACGTGRLLGGSGWGAGRARRSRGGRELRASALGGPRAPAAASDSSTEMPKSVASPTRPLEYPSPSARNFQPSPRRYSSPQISAVSAPVSGCDVEVAPAAHRRPSAPASYSRMPQGAYAVEGAARPPTRPAASGPTPGSSAGQIRLDGVGEALGDRASCRAATPRPRGAGAGCRRRSPRRSAPGRRGRAAAPRRRRPARPCPGVQRSTARTAVASSGTFDPFSIACVMRSSCPLGPGRGQRGGAGTGRGRRHAARGGRDGRSYQNFMPGREPLTCAPYVLLPATHSRCQPSGTSRGSHMRHFGHISPLKRGSASSTGSRATSRADSPARILAAALGATLYSPATRPQPRRRRHQAGRRAAWSRWCCAWRTRSTTPTSPAPRRTSSGSSPTSPRAPDAEAARCSSSGSATPSRSPTSCGGSAPPSGCCPDSYCPKFTEERGVPFLEALTAAEAASGQPALRHARPGVARAAAPGDPHRDARRASPAPSTSTATGSWRCGSASPTSAPPTGCAARPT